MNVVARRVPESSVVFFASIHPTVSKIVPVSSAERGLKGKVLLKSDVSSNFIDVSVSEKPRARHLSENNEKGELR